DRDAGSGRPGRGFQYRRHLCLQSLDVWRAPSPRRKPQSGARGIHPRALFRGAGAREARHAGDVDRIDGEGHRGRHRRRAPPPARSSGLRRNLRLSAVVADAPLWSPSPERVAGARITAFMRAVNDRHELALAGYRELYQWSIDRPEDFWVSLWDF